MQWEYGDTENCLAVTWHDDNTWSALVESETGEEAEEAEFAGIPDEKMRDLYQHLKKHYEG